VIAGFWGSPILGEELLHWIDPHVHGVPFDIHLLIYSATVIGGGGLLAMILYWNPEKVLEKMNHPQLFTRLFKRKYFMDDLYEFFTKKIALGLGRLMYMFDLKIPNKLMVDDSSRGIKRMGEFFSTIQNGLLQNYIFITLAFTLLFLIYIARSGSP